MQVSINKKKIYFYVTTFLLLSTFLNKDSFGLKEQFLIKKLNIITDSLEVKNQILKNTGSLFDKNIFFINEKEILNKLKSLNFLEKIYIKKKYPSTLIINAKITDIFAVTFLKEKKYFVGRNNEFILAKELNYEKKLPIIFGKFKISEFLDLKKNLQKKNIDEKNISKYYFHKNKRWDLHYSNNIIIKLPRENLDSAFQILNEFKNNYKIKPNSIVDLRISNRIILQNE